MRNLTVFILGLFAVNLYGHDEWLPEHDSPPTYWQGHADSSSAESEDWSPDIRGTSDSHPWHALNRWQGRVDPDRNQDPEGHF